MKRILLVAAAMAALSLPAAAQHSAPKASSAAEPRSGGVVVESLPLHLLLAGMRQAEAPRAFEDRMVFSAKGPFRFVGAAFEHEGFGLVHPFEKNKQGVFVLAFLLPLKRKEPLVYRLVVDGAWTADEHNPRKIMDRSGGLELSVVDVPYLSDLHLGKYEVLAEDGRTARFVFRGKPGEVVAVCGDFNNWDPFLHEMAETSPGSYELELPLSPGIHYYAFVYRGEFLADPLNPEKAVDAEGRVVSVLSALALAGY
jgi:hypothetical protein